jgi:hypothetical protein
MQHMSPIQLICPWTNVSMSSDQRSAKISFRSRSRMFSTIARSPASVTETRDTVT